MIECRPADRIKPRDAAAFEATRDACAVIGWSYEVVGTPGEVLLGNLRWLAGYRHPRHHVPELARHLRAIFHKPRPLLSGVTALGDAIELLPVLYHLLWRRDLHTDLTVPLHEHAMVAAAAELVTA